MKKTRRKKGIVEQTLRGILRGVYPKPLKFSEIKREIERRLGKVANKVIAENLKKLEERGEVQKKEGGWVLVNFCLFPKSKEFLESFSNLPASASFTGHSHTPYIELGPTLEISELTPCRELEELARNRFRREVERLLNAMPEKEKNQIIDFCAMALWAGYLHLSKFTLRIPLEKSSGALGSLMKNIDKEEWKHYLTEYLCTGIEDCLQRKLPTSGHKLSLLAYALLEPIYERCIFLKMPRDEETTIRRMSSKKKKFLAFLEEVDKIRFVYILPVGFKDLDEKTNELFYASSLISWPQRMKKWPDFMLELADLELEKTIDRIRQGLPPQEDFSLLSQEINDFYNHHPRGKDPEFYSEIREILQAELRRRGKEQKPI